MNAESRNVNKKEREGIFGIYIMKDERKREIDSSSNGWWTKKKTWLTFEKWKAINAIYFRLEFSDLFVSRRVICKSDVKTVGGLSVKDRPLRYRGSPTRPIRNSDRSKDYGCVHILWPTPVPSRPASVGSKRDLLHTSAWGGGGTRGRGKKKKGLNTLAGKLHGRH